MMKAKMRLVVPLLLTFAASAQAGTFYLSFNQHSTQNLFQTRDAVPDQISVFALAADQDISALSLLANVEYSAFHQTTGLSYFAAGAGIDYLVPAGATSAFYFAAGGTGAFYRESYEAFSTLGANIMAAFKTYLAPSSILKLQWQGFYMVYRDPLFDFLAHSASLSVDKYFTTRTTLKADAGWGYKYFLHPFLTEPPEPPAEPAAALAAPGGMGAGTGAGGYAGNGSGNGSGEPHYQGGYGFIPRYDPEGGGAGIGHISLSLLAAQGIGDALGLSASMLRQWIVSGENPFLSIGEFYLVQNPSSDEFSWDGHQLNGRLTMDLPWSVEVKTGYTYSDKTFPGVESFSLEGEPLGVVRNDVRHLLEARVEKGFRRLTVFLAYTWVDNRSTDPLFTWKSGYFMGGIEWSLPTTRKGGAS
jgi:hypothetical protein